MRILIPEWEPYHECIPVKLFVRERSFLKIKFSLNSCNVSQVQGSLSCAQGFRGPSHGQQPCWRRIALNRKKISFLSPHKLPTWEHPFKFAGIGGLVWTGWGYELLKFGHKYQLSSPLPSVYQDLKT